MTGRMHPGSIQMMKQMQSVHPFMMQAGMGVPFMNLLPNQKSMMGAAQMMNNKTYPNNLKLNENRANLSSPINPKNYPKASDNQRDKGNKNNANSIFVKNIPVESNNIVTLITYFNKFGEVINVNVNTTKNTAVVRFKNPNNAREAYMCKDKVLGIDSIQLVYNPGSHFSQIKTEEVKTIEDPKHPLKAEIGGHLKFESEEV